MIEIIEIIKYRTSDGIEFDNEEEARKHELQLALRAFGPHDLVVKNRLGEIIETQDIWSSVGSAYYVEALSTAALKFFNDASEAEGLEGLPHVGIFRYNECSDKWVTPQDDAQEIRERWEIFDEDINFTVT